MPSSSGAPTGDEDTEELTQKLGLQIIQIVTRNNALHPNSNHPDNVVLIRLMRTLLQDLERDGASSSVISQFFFEEQPIYERPADLYTAPFASSTSRAGISAFSEVNRSTPQVSSQSGSSQGSSDGEEGQAVFLQAQQSATSQSQAQWTNRSPSETLQHQQLINPSRAQKDQRNPNQVQQPQLEEDNQNTQNLVQGPQGAQQQQDQQQTQQGLGANDLLAQIGHLLGRNAQQDGSMNSGGIQNQGQQQQQQQQQGSAGPNDTWQTSSQQQQMQQRQQEDPQMLDPEPPDPSRAPQQPPTSNHHQQQVLAPTQQQQAPSPSGRSNMNMILLMALLANMSSEQQQQLAQQMIQQNLPLPQQQQPQPQQQQQPQEQPANQIQQPAPQQSQQQQSFGTMIFSLLQNALGNSSAPAATTTTTTTTNNNGPPPVAQAPEQPQQQQQQQGEPPRHAIREVNIPSGYPMRDIEYPGVHDVVLGRGRGASSHIGNVNFRGFIKQWKPKYAAANRVDKPKVAGEVVGKWRQKSPPGRFLVQVRTSTRNLWNDIGDHKARQKTSQSLRERECVRKPRRRKKRDRGSEEVASSEPMDDSSSVASDNSDIDDEGEESNMEESAAKMPAAAGDVGPSADSSTSAPRPVSGDMGESSSTSGDSSKTKSKEQSEGSDTS